VLQLERPRTRLQSGVSQPKNFTDGTIRYAYFCSTGEPSGIAEAFADSRWKAAMDEEYNALLKNGKWHLVPSTHGQNVIDCKWVPKHAWLLKVISNGMVLTMRTHLVMLSKQLLFVWFCPLLFLVAGIFAS
jgi:hypothetical protein